MPQSIRTREGRSLPHLQNRPSRGSAGGSLLGFSLHGLATVVLQSVPAFLPAKPSVGPRSSSNGSGPASLCHRDGRDTRLEGRRAEGRGPGGRGHIRRQVRWRRAGLALRRGRSGVATNGATAVGTDTDASGQSPETRGLCQPRQSERHPLPTRFPERPNRLPFLSCIYQDTRAVSNWIQHPVRYHPYEELPASSNLSILLYGSIPLRVDECVDLTVA
jgi:hypothetical protein